MDKRVLKILFNAYGAASGWTRGELRLSADDFAYAKAQRVMFDPVIGCRCGARAIRLGFARALLVTWQRGDLAQVHRLLSPVSA